MLTWPWAKLGLVYLALGFPWWLMVVEMPRLQAGKEKLFGFIELNLTQEPVHPALSFSLTVICFGSAYIVTKFVLKKIKRRRHLRTCVAKWNACINAEDHHEKGRMPRVNTAITHEDRPIAKHQNPELFGSLDISGGNQIIDLPEESSGLSTNKTDTKKDLEEVKSKSLVNIISDAVTGKYDADEQGDHHPTKNNEPVSLGDIWVMKPNGKIGGPFTKQYLKELKDSGKLPPGLKASRSKDGPWINLPTS